MKLSTIFRKAATYPNMSRGACVAIEWAMAEDKNEYFNWDYSIPHNYFNRLFKPEKRMNGMSAAAYWFTFDTGFSYDGREESMIKANNDRKLTLLLAAEIAKSEGQ